MITEPSR